MHLIARTTLRDQLHACMRMPHIHASITYAEGIEDSLCIRIDFLTHSLFGRAERYYFHSGACTHKTQVLIM